MSKTFQEVMKDIKPGEIWECTDKDVYAIKSVEMCGEKIIITQDHRVDTRLVIHEDARFERKEITFSEAFELYQKGKEIQSLISGNRYVILNGFEFIGYPSNSEWCQSFRYNQFSSNEIQGGWSINE